MVVAPTHFVVGVNAVSVGLFVHVSLKNSPKFSSFDIWTTQKFRIVLHIIRPAYNRKTNHQR